MPSMKVKDFGMQMHLNGGNYHSYVYSGTVDVPGHPCHGKKIVKSVVNYKERYGKPKQPSEIYWTLEPNYDHTFPNLDLLMKHYNIPSYNEEEAKGKSN